MMWYVKGEDIIPPKEGMGMELENDLIIMQWLINDDVWVVCVSKGWIKRWMM